MYAIKASIRKSRKVGEPGYIFFRVRDKEGAERMFATGVKTTEAEFTTTHKDYILRGLKCLYDIIERLYGSGKPFGLDNIASDFRSKLDNGFGDIDLSNLRTRRDVASIGKPFNKWLSPVASYGETYFDGTNLTIRNLPGYISEIMDGGIENTRASTWNNYKSTRNILQEFIATLSDNQVGIDREFVANFSDWLKGRGLADSTVSFYLRVLRTILYKARKEGRLEMSDDWFIGLITHSDNSDDPEKAVLTKDDLNRIANVNLHKEPQLDLARDIFLFSFYCRGIELSDILLLKPEDIKGDRLVYNKRKSGKQQSVKLSSQAVQLLNKHFNEGDEYFFQDVQNFTSSRVYHTLRKVITHGLIALSEKLGLNQPLTFSMARNTWLQLYDETNVTSMLLS